MEKQLRMKKGHFWKTILLTLGVVVVLAISAFGVVSLLAPVAMMDFTASLGLEGISGDYAYQEYERSGDVAYLARSFIVSADLKNDRTAESRFERLYKHDDFDEYCDKQDEAVIVDEEFGAFSYRGYVCGLAARVRYRLAVTAEDERDVLKFAADETLQTFPQANPLIALTAEAVRANDVAFCTRLLDKMKSGGYVENEDYQAIVNILEGIVAE